MATNVSVRIMSAFAGVLFTGDARAAISRYIGCVAHAICSGTLFDYEIRELRDFLV
jgi:hypothetical protein